MIVTPSAIATVAAAITPTATHSVKASLTSSTTQSFDWLTFFWGGAAGSFIGAFIILSIERLLDWILGAIKSRKEKEQIIVALKAEIESNIKICDDILEGYNANPGKIFPYHHHFSTSWLDIYKSKFIDLSKENDRDIYEKLDWFYKQVLAIEDQRRNMQLFDAFTQVTFLTLQGAPQLASHNHQGITNYNGSIAVMTNELRAKLKKFNMETSLK